MNLLGLLIAAYFALATNNFNPIPRESDLWTQFKEEFSKSYENEQWEELRQVIFAHNVHKINQFNKEAEEAQSFKLWPNHLTDMSFQDIKEMNGFKPSLAKERQKVSHSSLKSRSKLKGWKNLNALLNNKSIEVPDAVDWRHVPGRVSHVKNQGQCGSCWAFSAVGALEGQERNVIRNNSAIENGSIIELSEQNLVDCVTTDAGCGGGLMSDAFDFIKKEGGIDSEAAYPYEARNRKCRFDKSKSVLTDSGHMILPEGDEEALKEAVAKFGPVSVAIDASSLWFQFYHKGVYKNKHCGKKLDQLDHGVLVVGYGTDPKKGDYWIVKNSWGIHWGEMGYIKMARNMNNMCGIATVATLPIF